MRPTLLNLIVCPGCRGELVLDVVEASRHADPEREILDGILRCNGCARAYPVIGGVPRLLSPALLRGMRGRYPQFFQAHPEFLVDAEEEGHELADTLESFTRQRVDFPPPSPTLVTQWRTNLRRYVGDALDIGTLQGKRVLDVGCGFGRHMYVASEHGAEVVGVDLSGGVDRTYEIMCRRRNCHVVQANVLDRPFREGTFDIVWSFGVLHHMPDPSAGFRAIVPLARPDGGHVLIWVYGYSGMAFTYRLSHMRALHRRIRHLPGRTRVRASTVVAGVLSAFYWEPLRVARLVGFRGIVGRLPLADYIDHPWRTRIAGVHDRLSTPITHFHDRRELSGWYRSAGLDSICIGDTNRRGWRASGRRVMT